MAMRRRNFLHLCNNFSGSISCVVNAMHAGDGDRRCCWNHLGADRPAVEFGAIGHLASLTCRRYNCKLTTPMGSIINCGVHSDCIN